MEDSECLAEEAEELGMGVEECEVMAVQTRAQKKKEQEKTTRHPLCLEPPQSTCHN